MGLACKVQGVWIIYEYTYNYTWKWYLYSTLLMLLMQHVGNITVEISSTSLIKDYLNWIISGSQTYCCIQYIYIVVYI